jgi:hypothetical protein
MPDKYGFDHLPDKGRIEHRCIEEGCGWPGIGVFVSEADRQRHHRSHTRPLEKQRQKEIERQRLKNLAKAREVRANRQEGAV